MRKINNIDIEKTTPSERLKYIRLKTRLSRSEIQNKHKLSEATLKAWENGAAKITEKGLKRCINIYRKEGVVLSKEWVMTGEGISPKLSVDIGKYFASDLQYPLRNEEGKIQEQSTKYKKDDTTRMVREASYFKESYPSSVILMVTNDDMEPVYQIGDYVGGIFRYGENIKEALKRDCIIRLKTGEDMLRRLFEGNINKHYNLACINPLPTSEEPILFNIEIEAAAPIIWHRMPDVQEPA